VAQTDVRQDGVDSNRCCGELEVYLSRIRSVGQVTSADRTSAVPSGNLLLPVLHAVIAVISEIRLLLLPDPSLAVVPATVGFCDPALREGPANIVLPLGVAIELCNLTLKDSNLIRLLLC